MPFNCNRCKLESNGLVSGVYPDVVVSYYYSYCFFLNLIKDERADAEAPPQLLIQ